MSTPIVFKTDLHGHPITESGKPVTCDGCGAVLTVQPGPDQQQPVPADVAREVYGQEPGVLTYVVCERGAACFTLAQLGDEMHARTRCRVPDCRGDRCSVEGRPS
jgi:hypothetical protein